MLKAAHNRHLRRACARSGAVSLWSKGGNVRGRDNEELDLLETWTNPLLQPDKRFRALAGAALPVLIDRAGGSVRFTLAEFEAVQSRYGGKVSVMLE